MKKKTYTKYDYYCIQTKMGVATGMFALSLPMIVRTVKQYRCLQRKLWEQSPEEVEKDPDFKMTIQTTRQVWVSIVLMGVLAGTTFAFSLFSLWLMIVDYDTIFLSLFVLCATLTLPSLAMMIAYIRLLPITAELGKTGQSE